MTSDESHLVQMRDGVELDTQLYHPSVEQERPAILLRTPYGDGGESQLAELFVNHGFTAVVQQVRGTGDSEGSFTPMATERTDSVDATKWLLDQPWLDDEAGIGVFGMSYLFAASLPALANIEAVRTAVNISGFADLHAVTHRDHVGKLHHMLPWTISREYPDIERDTVDWDSAFHHTPAAEKAAAVGYPSDLWEEWCSLSEQKAGCNHWSLLDVVTNLDVPVLHVTGWYDLCRGNTRSLYEQLATTTTSPQHLLIGPWHHHNLFGDGTALHGIEFGDQSRPGLFKHLIAWFEWWLSGNQDGINKSGLTTQSSPVSVFVTRANRWEEFEEWPPDSSSEQSLYLRERGSLGEVPMGKGESTIIADPENPTPTGGGTVFKFESAGLRSGPVDREPFHERSDVRTFVTEPLDAKMTVAGSIKCTLSVSTETVPTTIAAKILDVQPDDSKRVIADGITRVTSSDLDSLDINCWTAAHKFMEGNRIGLELSLFDFPRFTRGPASGKPFEVNVRYGGDPSSCLKLPVL